MSPNQMFNFPDFYKFSLIYKNAVQLLYQCCMITSERYINAALARLGGEWEFRHIVLIIIEYETFQVCCYSLSFSLRGGPALIRASLHVSNLCYSLINHHRKSNRPAPIQAPNIFRFVNLFILKCSVIF